MSRAGLARIWTTLGALLALYAIGTWIILQGGKPPAEVPGIEAKAHFSSAYLAIPIVGSLLSVLCAVGLWYMRTPRGAADTLFPVVAVGDVGPHSISSWSMRLYQAFFVLIYLLIPGAALYQLNSVLLQRGVLWREGDVALGGIALKNAFEFFKGQSSFDGLEHACAGEILRSTGRIWLGSARCDFAKAGRLKPFQQKGESLEENANSAKGLSCTRELAKYIIKATDCEGVRDISEECETSERNCRGVEWLPNTSPLLLFGPTILGWIMLSWLLVEALWRKFAGRAQESESEARMAYQD